LDDQHINFALVTVAVVRRSDQPGQSTARMPMDPSLDGWKELGGVLNFVNELRGWEPLQKQGRVLLGQFYLINLKHSD